ncbi:FAS1-like dehydratase domain-containing protein [Serinibacter salmoneus]|uniref:Acyl dehydratase n=1 Tax=Serinibacter salmoneus TaxID=556530 RepID=A0A2A9CY15_9MICO|nr:MaoC family dehydratase N-terminal domain-containing protein [Serinibacter salmoneus]PFG18905.1 acyl dehydratase [Serinibacter salmoneus]
MAVDSSRIGSVFTGTPAFEVSRRHVQQFADVVGATSPVHRDLAAARAAGYPDLLAPVTFAVVIAQEAEAQYVADPASGIDFSRVVHAEESFAHHRPIVAGQALGAAVHVDDIVERRGLTMVTTRTEITDADGAAVATVGSTLAIRGAQE